MLLYKRRPGTIEAVLWTGINFEDVRHQVGTGNITESGSLYSEADRTWHQLVPGDWIARDGLGLYLIRGARFIENYEPFLPDINPNQPTLWDEV